MKKFLLLGPCIAAALSLAACGGASAQNGNGQAMNGGNRNGGPGQRPPMTVTAEQSAQYLSDANAAADKTELTKDEFTTEMQTMMETQRAQFQQSGQQGSRSFSGGMMRPGNGQPRFGSGSRAGGAGMMANAASYVKYTDANGAEVLLALDANGTVIMKWPRPMRAGGMMRQQPGDSDPVGGNP